MASFSVFYIDTARHPLAEVLHRIQELGYSVARTKRLDHSEEMNEVGFQILGTDITISDPQVAVVFRGQPTIVSVLLPFPATGLQKSDPNINRKVYRKLKKEFETRFPV